MIWLGIGIYLAVGYLIFTCVICLYKEKHWEWGKLKRYLTTNNGWIPFIILGIVWLPLYATVILYAPVEGIIDSIKRRRNR